MVGMAQLVSAPDCGSGGRGFESLYPPCCDSSKVCASSEENDMLAEAFDEHRDNERTCSRDVGLSPSGKALDFDSSIRRFESY